MSSEGEGAEHPHPPAPGMASPDELRVFVEQAGDRLVVIDVRDTLEDAASLTRTPLPSADVRPHGVHVPWDRAAAQMIVPDHILIDKEAPIITHCGGGGRGQMAKEFLEQQGFTNVINGGGPKHQECWKIFGEK